ncbi:hypothetical protein LCGC14_0630240 [marine sediment metagenome]|uniref:DUF3168 domain-containing protein n=1 Tax=marine sediment metagenome TaxID=412755 RepID=A0A0F9R217_9ZZZZ
MIDVNRALIAFLATDAPLVANVSTRVWTPRLLQSATFPAINLFVANGRVLGEIPIIETTFQITCWHGTDAEKARETSRLLHDALHGKANQNIPGVGFMLTAFEDVLGQDIVDPDNGWFSVLSFYRVRFREN